MKFPRFAFALLALSLAAHGQSTPDVGSGSPNATVQRQFQLAFYRGGFAYTVSLPPLADVKRLGTSGLVQEFQDAAKTSGVRLALIMPNVNAAVVEGKTAVFQMQAAMYAYFSAVGVNTAGMPVIDTANCPSLVTANSCTYQLFDKPYALFVYKNPVNNGASTFFTRAAFYTTWDTLGGIAALGPAVSAETTVTASTATTATAQYFDQGVIYTLTSGANSGRIFSVKAPIYTLFAANNLEAGFLGLPTSGELAVANGRRRQTFEGGSIEYDPANPTAFPVLRYPVAAITVSAPSSIVRLKLGESVTLQANVTGPNGLALTDRPVLWTTSNGRIVTVDSGNPATVRATGGGTATVIATSEGKSSAPVTFVVTAPCCQVGEGAPEASVVQAFQDAVTRNRLSLKLPAPAAAARAGSGYIQRVESTDGVPYLIAVPDRTRTGFLIGGTLLARYLELGGPAGSLGYPLSDASSGGRQTFENGTLAGDPVQLVSGDILAKWALLGYERGAAGNPAAPAATALTFRATRVETQAFQAARLVSILGLKIPKTYAVSGLMLLKYMAAAGVEGRLGAPINDEYCVNNLRRQDFEGGRIEYAPGDAEARVTEAPRQPVVIATPPAVLAGTRVTLALGGFNERANVRVSVTGQPDFIVTVPTGAHVWDSYISATARSGSIVVRAVDTASAANTAQAVYTVRAVAEARLQIAAESGDAQTGVPGALLPLPLVAIVRDESGNAVEGLPVRFTASPGATVATASAMTDENGLAWATLRLQPTEGVALVTLEAGRQVLTLSARALRTAFPNFPKLTQAVDGLLGDGPETIAQKGALLAAAASMVRYLQSRGEAPSPNGLADVALLNQHLRGSCGLDPQGQSVCDGFVRTGQGADPIVNLWRIPAFAGNAFDIAVAPPRMESIRDLIGLGVPALVALRSGPFVVATGVAADGGILVADPNPATARATLEEYSSVVTGVAAFMPRAFRPGGFLVAANASIDVTSAAGPCGATFSQLHYCAGLDSLYQVDLSGPAFRGVFLDLGPQPARFELIGGVGQALQPASVSFKAQRANTTWSITPIDLAIAENGVVNAASFTPPIAPGGLATIFGAGFGRAPALIHVQINGVTARVFSVNPFQLNFEVPPQTEPGLATVRVASPLGEAEGAATVSALAPALFTLGDGRAAAVNPNGTINSSTNPAPRGNALVFYGTGFGAVSPDGAVMRTRVPVTAAIGGINVPVLFAGLAPGFPGLYQINLMLPPSLPPGLALDVSIQQSNLATNTVQVAVQ